MSTHPITVFKFIRPYARAILRPMLFGIAMFIVGEGLSRVGIWFGSRLINLLSVTTADKTAVMWSGLGLILLCALCTAIRGILVNFTIRVDAFFIPRLCGRIYKDLFKHVHKHSPAYFEMEMSGNLAAKINNVVDNCETIYYSLMWGLFNSASITLVSFIAFIAIDWKLGILFFVCTGLFFCSVYYLSKPLIKYSTNYVAAETAATAQLVDSITNAETVKSFGRLAFEKKHYFNTYKKLAKAREIALFNAGHIFCLQGALRSLLRGIFCLVPFFMWYYDQLTLADFIFLQGVSVSFNSSLGSSVEDLSKFFDRYGGIQEGLDTLFKPLTVVDAPDAEPFVYKRGKIEFSSITYRYQTNKPLFKNFSLTIKPGEKVGLVGYSGSGKSSLIKLLLRYYDVESGAILIDGQPLTRLIGRSVRRSIALIPQEPSLFNRTIMENIRYSNPTATDEDVIRAAKQAYCHDFIMRLPNGYESRVGERGVMLSGGERQRIAIARAILKNAPILILDEATSALDSESEHAIQKSLTQLMKNKTVIAVAHRLSTLKKMNRIVVLDKGKIIESGTHTELVKKTGVYRQFYEIQTTAFNH